MVYNFILDGQSGALWAFLKIHTYFNIYKYVFLDNNYTWAQIPNLGKCFYDFKIQCSFNFNKLSFKNFIY